MKKKKGSDDILKPEKISVALLEIFKNNPGRNYNPRQLAKMLRKDVVKAEGKETIKSRYEDHFNKLMRQAVTSAVDKLVKEEKIIESEPYRYRLKPVRAMVEGTIDVTQSGAAYLMIDNGEDDVYISEKYLRNALHGDRVKVLLHPRHKNRKMEGEVMEILERARHNFTGTVQLSHKYAFLVPDSSRMHTDIFIPLEHINGAKNGMKAIAEITEWERGRKNPIGKIIELLGMPGENETEILSILTEFGLPNRFPHKVEAEVAGVRDTILKIDIEERKDFRNVTTFTIDPVDAKDFDDALSIRRTENNRWEIGVHIADVSHYVKEDSLLDKEAYKRATSVYLVDRVVPMLPEKLSNDLCSLRPKEDKLCYSAVFTLDDYSVVHSKWFGRTIIHSDKRFTYEEAQEILNKGEGIFYNELKELNRLAKILRKERFSQGAIGFEKTETRFELDAKGNPVNVFLKETLETNNLIEEFMLLANKYVAELIGKSTGRKMDFVYRIHEGPVAERIADFARVAQAFGYKINTSNDKTISKSLNKLLNDVKGKDEQNMLEQLAIRSMSKARYTSDNVGHYGLAFDYYTHFTSPIRRYPDIMVHRLLNNFLEGKKGASKNLEDRCKHCTDMEIRATDAERTSNKFMQAKYMLTKKGQEFAGIITGLTDWGIYVEMTENKCEGMVRMRDLEDDFYEFDEYNFRIKGARTGKIYRLGDHVKVKVKNSDLVKKQIDLLMADGAEGKARVRKTKKQHRRF